MCLEKQTCRSVGWVLWRIRSPWSPCVRWYMAAPSCSDSLISGSRLWWRGRAALSGKKSNRFFKKNTFWSTDKKETMKKGPFNLCEEQIFTSGRQNSGCESTNTRPEHSFSSYNTQKTNFLIWKYIDIYKRSMSSKHSLFPGLWLRPWKPILGAWIVLDCKSSEQNDFYQSLIEKNKQHAHKISSCFSPLDVILLNA